MINVIGEFVHPIHGKYFIFFDQETNCFGLSKDRKPIYCGYASISAMLKVKGM